ncbi:hypothetical protein CDCA_CDCA01G0100 [Cyanidium caldarium]|uniref:Dolichyl-diphosphooligosaccharide--protein glycosyltransferase subunit OST2 n=1 Tax=Cyanidium caldarium TaxID=2771 RepID=A0AAV9IPR1_CYACA|nr:hypothetical protein CDCA_CDCA01G0100 [Cyanidium caldarium]
MSSTQARRVLHELASGYRSVVPRELRLIDLYLVCLVATAGCLATYGMLAGTFPFNAFLSAMFCCLGSFVITVSLRMQLNPVNQAEDKHRWQQLTPELAYIGWTLCHLVLFLTVVNFIG